MNVGCYCLKGGYEKQPGQIRFCLRNPQSIAVEARGANKRSRIAGLQSRIRHEVGEEELI